MFQEAEPLFTEKEATRHAQDFHARQGMPRAKVSYSEPEVNALIQRAIARERSRVGRIIATVKEQHAMDVPFPECEEPHLALDAVLDRMGV